MDVSEYAAVHGIDEHPIPFDPEEIEKEWEQSMGTLADEEPPHPDVAHERYKETIAEYGEWEVFRLRPPFGDGSAVFFWNREGRGFYVEDECGRWHELVNLFAAIVEEQGDCRDAEYTSSMMPSGSHNQSCSGCGAGWSI